MECKSLHLTTAGIFYTRKSPKEQHFAGQKTHETNLTCQTKGPNSRKIAFFKKTNTHGIFFIFSCVQLYDMNFVIFENVRLF